WNLIDTIIFTTPFEDTSTYWVLTLNSTVGAITGCMLGDGHIQLKKKNPNSRANGRYIITIKASSKKYIEQLITTVFYSYSCGILNPYPNPKLSQHSNKEILQYSFTTANLSFFTDLHHLWYKWDSTKGNYRKVVPKNISSFFNEESLVHWLIQDGYYDGHERTKTVFFCTECFTKKECFLLQKVLSNYGLKSSLKIRNKSNLTYRIRISKTSINQLRSIVSSSIPAEFHYKLGI
ncbi:unnamed protein product, partial (mitochondrion) [Parajaminaea phylloscopi]